MKKQRSEKLCSFVWACRPLGHLLLLLLSVSLGCALLVIQIPGAL